MQGKTGFCVSERAKGLCMRKCVVLLLLALFAGESASAEKEKTPWELVRNKKGIKVYTRKVEGIDFKEFKGVTVVETSLASLVALITDVEATPTWMANCSRCELLKQINGRETITYSFSKSPAWPVSHRDTITHNTLAMDKETSGVTLRQTGKPEYIAPKKKVVRVTKIECLWQFTPLPDGMVQVTYQSVSDPGGGIPQWLVNSSLVSQPYQTLLKMRKVVSQEKYQKATMTALGLG